MLTIAADILPQTGLSYVAFRVAFLETLERVSLAQQIDDDGNGTFGYLTEVPFLRSIPPHVQLDLLAETWSKHASSEPFEADLVDESVVYAACETTARIAENEPEVFARHLPGGPMAIDVDADSLLAAELRGLHLNLSNEGDFLVISQFEDLPPDEARRLKREFGLDECRFEPMFEVLGLWTMSAAFLDNLKGLLLPREVVRAATELGSK